MTLLDKLRWGLLSPSNTVLVAVSGGPDSLCLLHVLWTEREAHQIGRVEAAHLDHGLRGDESAAEAAWVARWCQERGIVCHLGQADVKGLARKHHQSIQEAARNARYEFLEQTAAFIGADKTATGHTRDDQAETVLANVLRGTGMTGLRGIPAQRGRIVRPLLDMSRTDVEAYNAANGLVPRQDASNLLTQHYKRNRIRLDLLPLIRRDYNPRVEEALLRLSETAGRDGDYLNQQAATALAEVTRTGNSFCLEMDRAELTALHPALLRYVLRLAIDKVRGSSEGISYEHLETICQAIRAVPALPFAVTLPCPLCVVRAAGAAVTVERQKKAASGAALSVPISLPVPGEVLLESGWRVRAAGEDHTGAVCLDAGAVDAGSLHLRNWHSGDRIDPLGMGGRHKKLSDIFSDLKIVQRERSQTPLVADSRGIVWVAGLTLAERAKVTPGTREKLFLSARKVTFAETPAETSAGNTQDPLE